MSIIPKLTQVNRDARTDFAKRFHNFNQWDSVIFSYEKKWNLDGPDGLAYHWYNLSKDGRWFST